MTDKQKEVLRTFERNTRLISSDGGKSSVGFLVAADRKHNNPTGLSLPQYLEEVHAWLYYYFVIDWSKFSKDKLPTRFGSGVEFGEWVIKEWHKICVKNKYFNYEYLASFVTADQLKGACVSLFKGIEYIGPDGKLSWDFNDALMQLVVKRDEQIAEEQRVEEENRKAAELEKLEQEAQRKREEAKRKENEEKERRRKEEEAERTKQNLESIVMECYVILSDIFSEDKDMQAVIGLQYLPHESIGQNFASNVKGSKGSDVDGRFLGRSFLDAVSKTRDFLSDYYEKKKRQKEKDQKKQTLQEQMLAMQKQYEEQMRKMQEQIDKL